MARCQEAWSQESSGTLTARRIAHCSGHPAGHEQQLALAGLLTGTSSPILAFPDPKRGPVVLRGQAPCLQLRGQFHFVPRRALMSGGRLDSLCGRGAVDGRRQHPGNFRGICLEALPTARRDAERRVMQTPGTSDMLTWADFPCGTKAAAVYASTLLPSNDDQRCQAPERYARVKESLP